MMPLGPAVRPLVLLVVLALGCASRQGLPPGNELEFDEEEGGSGAGRSSFERAPTNEKALAEAFEAPTEKPAPVSVAAGDSPPPPALQTDASAPVGEAPLLEQQAHQQAHAEAIRSADLRTARLEAEQWLLSCGPKNVDGCRQRALRGLDAVAKVKGPESAPAKQKATEVRSADKCLVQAEAAARAKRPVPGCLDSAMATYRKWKDSLMVARVLLARGQSALRASDKAQEAAASLSKAERECHADRCVAIRRRALKLLSSVSLQLKDLDGALKASLREMKLAASELPPEQRLYARSAEVDRLCALVDQKEGQGACRKAEKAQNGTYSFRDFSLQKAGRGLGTDKAREVFEHFGVLMQECLADEAERLVPPASETYEIRWMVNQTGRVEQAHVGKKHHDEGALGQCLRAQFTVWRYPRYEGEAQHIEQKFTLSARERRSASTSR
jgi:hypothetical protein